MFRVLTTHIKQMLGSMKVLKGDLPDEDQRNEFLSQINELSATMYQSSKLKTASIKSQKKSKLKSSTEGNIRVF